MFSLKDLNHGVLWHIADKAVLLEPVSPDIADAVKRRDTGYLVRRRFNYCEDSNILTLIWDRQVCALFSKLDSCDIGVDTEAVAFSTWSESEDACRETNRILRTPGLVTPVPSLRRTIEGMRRYIKRVLGRAPIIGKLHLHFGPGSTTAVPRKQSNPQYKMGSGFQCSERLAYSGFLPSILHEVPHWCASTEGVTYGIDDEGWLYERVAVRLDTGKLNFVPKNALTKRTIVIEPNVNGLVQQGLRLDMERRLGSACLATRDQSINRSRAREGSVTGEYATIDLSSASDMIATELVRQVVPPDWFALLDACRTQDVRYKGRVYSQQKFSSMGNATTFPLETLLFAACCHTITNDFTVYGDDICVPTTCAADVMAALESLGFKVNRSKSFMTGPFRESCGGDYFRGVDIRPHYVEHLNLVELYTMHNFFWDRQLTEYATSVLQFIPRECRFYGPERLGDCVLHSEKYPSTNNPDHQSRGVTVLVSPKVTLPSLWPGDWATPLYTIYQRGSGDEPSQGLRFTKAGRPMWDAPSVDDDVLVRMKIYIS